MIDIIFIGWHYNMNVTNYHDKIWIAFKMGNNFYCGWGKRGKILKFKFHGSGEVGQSMINVLIDKKSKPYGNYTDVDIDNIDTVVPNFQHMVETQLVLATLKDTII